MERAAAVEGARFNPSPAPATTADETKFRRLLNIDGLTWNFERSKMRLNDDSWNRQV
ncbi:MAG TPA: hypothetical protein PLY87_14075 [Planctomycetaceae bacterium]|nr:hypothetical protein [Planctomycetaceae bacterium]HQZ66210.1 hypothetical protein [Planctomycetaceae bacterium]